MGQVSSVSHRRTEEISHSLQMELFEVSDKEGRSRVGLKLNEQLADGGVREFRTDCSTLAFIDKRVDEFAKNKGSEEHFEEIGGTKIHLKRMNFGDGEEAIEVKLVQKDNDGRGDWQGFKTYADDLKAAVQEGQKLQSDLGLDKTWHVLVHESSLTRGEDGRTHASVAASFEYELDARMFLAKSSGVELYSVPQTREYTKGESIDLWDKAKLVDQHQIYANSVEQKLGEVEWSRDRRSEHYVIAKWNDASGMPEDGQRVRWERSGYDYTGKPEDYLAGPIAGRDRGKSAEPMWVLIERDPKNFSVGIVKSFSTEREKLVPELKMLEEGRNVNLDLKEHSFTMDRNQYTQGQSM